MGRSLESAPRNAFAQEPSQLMAKVVFSHARRLLSLARRVDRRGMGDQVYGLTFDHQGRNPLVIAGFEDEVLAEKLLIHQGSQISWMIVERHRSTESIELQSSCLPGSSAKMYRYEISAKGKVKREEGFEYNNKYSQLELSERLSPGECELLLTCIEIARGRMQAAIKPMR